MNTIAKRAHASRIQLIEMNDILRTVLDKDEKTGLVSYKDGWSDEIVAKRVNCNVSSVSNTRVELFGRIVNRIAADARVLIIEEKLLELTIKYDRLVNTLALNKVADVKHLTINQSHPKAMAS